MKHLIILSLAVLSLTACGNRNSKKTVDSAVTETTVQTSDPSTVYVYYFHGKQRCKTCIAVGNVSEKAVKDMYADNPNVKFIEVQTDDEANAALVEKYEVTWNALIVAKGSDNIEITKQAFASAVNNPENLTDLIKTEVDKRL
ncbi:nitrophenyl compound nitroreductase subunit ArsF family protein [Bacteroides intestinalis]|jgi:ABC-type glycerol-3-phosphate transport system substrate-binding protein|uniref:nitrophenyl compound nitroreductase subunit ArsF family protein n=1 Tax=Bacteroides intestinalis TaxID=329854 RepID=UPI0022E7D994|nr:nitrophenyl compound nitroreductase subunit ArsF family protein [Bacteroides intestinalis]